MSTAPTDSVGSSPARSADPVASNPPSLDEALAAVQRKLSGKQLRSILEARDYTMALWVGAVSAGKTFATLFAFLLAILRVPEGERIIIVGVTLKTIEGNVISQLQDPKRFGILAKHVIHTTGASTAIILGRVVELIGAPNALAASKITGATIALAYVDEAVLIPEPFWDMLETRLRVKGARLIATTNPASQNHWLRKKYILAAADHDLIVFHFTMRDNPIYWPGGEVGPAYILRMIRANVGMFFQRFILGLWTNAAGAIYDMWDVDKHVIAWEAMPKIARILAVGIDYGASHATSAIMLGVTDEYDDRGRWRPRLIFMDEWRHVADDEAGVAQMAPSLMADAIRDWLRADHTPGVELARPQFIFVDPSARGFREELKLKRVGNTEADNDHAGISDIASLLAQGRLIVTDRCAGWIEEITEYVWDAKKTAEGEDEPVKIKDDSMDAGRYAIRSTREIWMGIFRSAYGLAA